MIESLNYSEMSREQKIREIELLEARKEVRRNNLGKRVYEGFYDWQRRFNAATASHTASMLMAANQVGKSQTGCCIDAHHLTGEYPDDWEGHRFDFPPLIWLLGFSMEKCRDLLQTKLFGKLINGEFEGGYVPKDKIIDKIPMHGTKNAMREVTVKHKYGTSTVQFWSYSQGQHALMGDVVDWYHIDEEPKDPTIFPQVLTRTLNGDRGKGGRGILTFTPENGKTELVCHFMGEAYESEDDDDTGGIDLDSCYLQTATWADAPHMTEEMKKAVLSMYPAYQRKMRSMGVPLMGSGLIYEHDEEDIKIEPFSIPDHWFVIDGMDFGWDHPQAHVQLVENRDTGDIYLTNAWKKSKKHPYQAWHIVRPWAEGVPTAWPHDGLKGQLKSSNSAANDGETLKDLYYDEGFNMLDVHATWEDGGNSVQRGIMEFNNLMEAGKFKVFSNLFEFFEEMRQYHTKTNASGQTEIVKVKDDLLDAARYAYMMRRYAIRIFDLNPDNYRPQTQAPQMGYGGD